MRVLAGVAFPTLATKRLALPFESSWFFLLLVPYDARPAVEGRFLGARAAHCNVSWGPVAIQESMD